MTMPGIDKGLSRRVRVLRAVLGSDVCQCAGDDVHDDGAGVRVPWELRGGLA